MLVPWSNLHNRTSVRTVRKSKLFFLRINFAEPCKKFRQVPSGRGVFIYCENIAINRIVSEIEFEGEVFFCSFQTFEPWSTLQNGFIAVEIKFQVFLLKMQIIITWKLPEVITSLKRNILIILDTLKHTGWRKIMDNTR